MILGTSSDRIGTPDGQAYFGTLSKSLERWTGFPFAPYAGVAYGEFEERWRAIGGLRVGYGGGWSSTLIHDGVNFHPTLEYTDGPHVITLLWVDTREVGIAYSLSF